MEKIELNKRTLRTLTMSEVSRVAGADAEDGDAEDDNAAKPKTEMTECASCPTETRVCPPPSVNCPPTADVKCCPRG